MDLEFRELLITDGDGIREMSAVATAILRDYYDPIIGKEQNDYMLAKFQTPDAIRGQLASAIDVIIHLGDHDRDTICLKSEFPEIPLFSVRGNCDFFTTAPDRDIVPLGPVKAFITHGHLYNVDWSTDSLAYAAQEAECQIAMFGHTHEAMNGELGSIRLLNPGTAGKGRILTYAWVEVNENGGIATEIRKL